jgi:hypothetical protein
VKRQGTFLVLWTLAVAATSMAYVTRLALRGRAVELGYELGRAHGRLGRLREVKRVLELELASYKTPERVELISRSLLGMEPPTADRILPAGPEPAVGSAADGNGGLPANQSPGDESP